MTAMLATLPQLAAPRRATRGKSAAAVAAAHPLASLASLPGPLLGSVLAACGRSGAGKLAVACHGLHGEVFWGTLCWEKALANHEVPVRVHAALRQKPPQLRQGEVVETVQLGLGYCERFMELFVARNRLQEFVLRSMEDFVVWLRRIATLDASTACQGKGPRRIATVAAARCRAASATVAVCVVRRRLALVEGAEALVKAGLADGLRVLRAMQECCREAAPPGAGEEAQAPPVLPQQLAQNLTQLMTNVARLVANVESFLSVACRCAGLAAELAAEAESLEGRLRLLLAAPPLPVSLARRRLRGLCR